MSVDSGKFSNYSAANFINESVKKSVDEVSLKISSSIQNGFVQTLSQV